MTVDTFKRFYDGLIPFLLVILMVATIVFRVQAVDAFHRSAAFTRATACQAVRDSNGDLDKFLDKRAKAVNDPQFTLFVTQLAIDHAATYARCVNAEG